jgi:hypothetical protein
MSFVDEVMLPRAGDLFVGLGFNPIARSMRGLLEEYRIWRTSGVGLHFAFPDAAIPADVLVADGDLHEPEGDFEAWTRFAASIADGFVCGSTAAAEILGSRLDRIPGLLRRPPVQPANLHGLAVGAFPASTGSAAALPNLLDLIIAKTEPRLRFAGGAG